MMEPEFHVGSTNARIILTAPNRLQVEYIKFQTIMLRTEQKSN